MHLSNKKEESVEELLQKLAKKGKKVKLRDESASVKELPPRQEEDEDVDDNLERDGNDLNDNNEDDQ